ncbi:unnamed protein product [Larinioides sclopetarius]|uniref:Uncharacterized protein n=1 Tax=Larinioides sclopetarius TaxID=280406 RepID=A0AAV1ZJS6_9ARAC
MMKKSEIISKLKQRVTFKRIFDDVRDNNDIELQRIHLLTRKDLHNLTRDCHSLNYTMMMPPV